MWHKTCVCPPAHCNAAWRRPGGYQALLDATRHELACHYLARSAMPIAEVGFLLGYQDAPAFHHAFKQWQGQGPGQYRAAALRA